ncbi:MAG: Hsp70 family protein, partial [Pseudomonadota bacterium]
EVASANKSLGKFDLGDIPPAPRGVPQVEVSFDIDANGILNVSAKDKATGRKQSIIVKASSGLSESEIQRMVKDAETHREDDRRFQELVTTRNKADTLIHATKKSMGDLGAELEAEERARIESALRDLESAMKSDNKETIETKITALSDVSGKMAERIYQKRAAESATESNAQKPGGSGSHAHQTGGEAAHKEYKDAGDVVDAEFEEVKDTRR